MISNLKVPEAEAEPGQVEDRRPDVTIRFSSALDQKESRRVDCQRPLRTDTPTHPRYSPSLFYYTIYITQYQTACIWACTLLHHTAA
jgi:hypothetical protein